MVTYVAIYHPPCTAIVSDDFHLRTRRPVIVQLVPSPWMVAHEGVAWLPCTQSERSDSCPCLSVRILVHFAEKLWGTGCRGQMREGGLKSVNIRAKTKLGIIIPTPSPRSLCSPAVLAAGCLNIKHQRSQVKETDLLRINVSVKGEP